MKKQRPTHVLLTDRQAVALQQWSETTGESQSVAIRLALNAWLPTQSPSAPVVQPGEVS